MLPQRYHFFRSSLSKKFRRLIRIFCVIAEREEINYSCNRGRKIETVDDWYKWISNSCHLRRCVWCCVGISLSVYILQGDSFGTRSKKMRISQRLFIRFWTCVYDYIPCFMKSMSILEEMLEMFATTVQADLNATLHVCESGLQDVLAAMSRRMLFCSSCMVRGLLA